MSKVVELWGFGSWGVTGWSVLDPGNTASRDLDGYFYGCFVVFASESSS